MTTETRPHSRSHARVDPLTPAPPEIPEPRWGRTLLAGVVAGGATAVGLTMTVFAGAGEAVTTGALLLGFALGWAVMALLGRRRSGQPQPWAVVPGVAMGVTGAALLLTRPGARTMDALAWVWPPLVLALVVWTWVQLGRAVPGRGRWVLAPVLGSLALASIGAVAGNLAVIHDRSTYPPSGRLYEVDGHRLHIDCRGPRSSGGSPTVVLSSSLGGTSADWSRVVAAISPTTRTCAYDRAGQGWSEEASSPRDGIQSATELHTLLAEAGEHEPYVLAGHSTGGTYAMTYAARYPDEVAGLVLVDSSSPQQFTRMPAYRWQYQLMRRTYGPLSTLSRTGLGHLLPAASGLPAEDAARVHAVTSATRSVRNQRDEVSVIPAVFRQAQALTGLGDRPLAVVTASDTAEHTSGWAGAQDALAALSSSSVHRTVRSTHLGMVGDPGPAAEVVRALRDVLTAVRTHGHLPAR